MWGQADTTILSETTSSIMMLIISSIPLEQQTQWGYVLAIHLYEAQKWLREEKRLHIEVRWYCNMWYDYEVKEAEGKVLAEGSAFNTYEDALITAIYMATEHLKER